MVIVFFVVTLQPKIYIILIKPNETTFITFLFVHRLYIHRSICTAKADAES